MKTEIYESDPFAPRKGKLLVTIETDYRFEKNDEFHLETGGGRVPLRVTHVRVQIDKNGALSREILCLKL